MPIDRDAKVFDLELLILDVGARILNLLVAPLLEALEVLPLRFLLVLDALEQVAERVHDSLDPLI